MNTKIHHLVLVAGVLITGNVSAMDEKIFCTGYCWNTCGEIISDDTGYFEEYAFVWAQGFLSGLNESSLNESGEIKGEVTDLTDTDGMKAWLKSYCENNALDIYYLATKNLWIELRRKQGLRPDPRF